MSKNISCKTVTIRFPIDVEIEVPEDWDKDMIEFHVNESSWCVGNILPKLQEYADRNNGCLCHRVNEWATLVTDEN